jgi:hypothetical protein
MIGQLYQRLQIMEEIARGLFYNSGCEGFNALPLSLFFSGE